jgi:Tfp pilus assembly protein PilX
MIDMRHLVTFKRHLADENGFLMIVAMFVLLIISVLVAVAIAVSSQTSTSTTRDSSTKAALEAAEAGLQVAAFRLSRLAPGEAQCVTEGTVPTTPTLPATGEKIYCEDATKEPLGNGATFQYWTSKALAAGVKCASATAELGQRCITSEGIANGVTPGTRLQTLVKPSPGQPLFAVAGVVGLEEFTASGGTISGGEAGSNGKLTIEGGAALKEGYVLGPKGEFVHKGGATWNPPETKHTEAEGPLTAELPVGHATAEKNEDSRIGVQDEFYTEGKVVNKFTGSPNYELNISSNGILTLSGSKYYLCNFTATNNSTLRIAATAKVEIFIDAPTSEDPTSKCPAGTGKFEGTGAFKLENLSNNPGALLIDMYGKGPFVLEHGAAAVAVSVDAPKAEVILTGGTTLTGAVVGAKVHLERGFSFEWNGKANSWTNGITGAYERKTWEQCTPGSGATEGC